MISSTKIVVPLKYLKTRRLFVPPYVVAAGAANDEADMKNNKKYFLPSVNTL